MISKLLFHTRLLIYVLLLADIVFAIVSFLNDFSSFVIFIYAIVSALIYIFLFSINKNSTKKENKFYAIISPISFCLLTYITFGSYYDLKVFIGILTTIYAIIAYVYYQFRNKYKQIDVTILVNTLYMIVKVGLLFILILAMHFLSLGV